MLHKSEQKRRIIAELFSQPRIREVLYARKDIETKSIDLKTGWDLLKNIHQRQCTWALEQMEPDLVIGTPVCTRFSRLQNLNVKK